MPWMKAYPPLSPDRLIEVHDAVVSYREDVALRGVSLEVHRGELVGILGPNGAGKTTLLTLVNGLGTLVSGEVRVLGQRVGRRCPSSLRQRIGYVPQSQDIDPRTPVNVREAVMMGRYGRLGLLRRPARTDWQAVDNLLELVGLAHLAERPVGHLSGGERQRVAIARALAQEPEILLLDEPTTALDGRARAQILRLVEEIHQFYGLTTLLVTHELHLAAQLCHRLVLMKRGRIWAQGATDEILKEDTLAALFNHPLSPAAPGAGCRPSASGIPRPQSLDRAARW
jgi:ABC-type cobalamin/Fe3+-siderophores transport system ATPase subunit